MKNPFTRRSFLKTTAFTSAALATGFFDSPRAAIANDPIKRPGHFSVKPALNVYSFNSQLPSGVRSANPRSSTQPARAASVTLFDLLDFCATHNLDAIDATGYYFPNYPDAPPDSWLYDFKKRACQLGVDILGTGTRNTFITPDKSLRDEGVKHIKLWVEIASRLGAPILRVFADDLTRNQSWKVAVPNNSHDEVQSWTADALRECADHGQKHGVVIAVQNHGDFNGSANEFLALIKRVDSEWCAPTLDTGYFNTPDPYVDIAAVAPYAINWTVKQSIFDGGYGATPIDLDKIMTIVKSSGYRGYLPIETLAAKGQPKDPFQTVPAYLNRLRAAIAKATV
jgi:sugar phosphate isomerase/epimerase